jgi:hypothetical protein
VSRALHLPPSFVLPCLLDPPSSPSQASPDLAAGFAPAEARASPPRLSPRRHARVGEVSDGFLGLCPIGEVFGGLPDLTELALLFPCCVVFRRGFLTRHRRKILVSLGVAGVGYAAYRLYDAHRSQLVRVEQLRAKEEEAADDLVKNQEDAILFPTRCGSLAIDLLGIVMRACLDWSGLVYPSG